MTDQSASDDRTSPSSCLAQILLITEEMLALAHKDSWDLITELEEQRREALAVCFSSPVPPSQAEVFSEALAAMLHMNEEMISLLELAKENVAIKRADQKYVKRSLGHYLDVDQNQ